MKEILQRKNIEGKYINDKKGERSKHRRREANKVRYMKNV